MANLPVLAHCYVDDIDAATMKALKINPTTHSPQFMTSGDTAPTGIEDWHIHWESGAGTGNEPYFSQPGVGVDKLLGARFVAYQFMVPFDTPQVATGTITVVTNPTQGTLGPDNYWSLRIGPVANTYRILDTPVAAKDVQRGTTADETARNIGHALYAMGAVAGTQFHAGTEPHPTVYAEFGGTNTTTLRARQGGQVGNSIITSATAVGAPGGSITMTAATLGHDEFAGTNRGGGNNLARGSAYYSPGGWQLSASHGYHDDRPRRLVAWTYQAPALPTIQDSGAATETVQLELMHSAATPLYTLTVTGGTEAIARTQYSNSGGTAEIPASVFVWARVPTPTGATWKAPPGASWTLYFARQKG